MDNIVLPCFLTHSVHFASSTTHAKCNKCTARSKHSVSLNFVQFIYSTFAALLSKRQIDRQFRDPETVCVNQFAHRLNRNLYV